MAVGVAAPMTPDVPVQTAVADVQQPAAQTVSVDLTPADGSGTLPAKAAGGCTGIDVRATELVFSDSFETGDTDWWGPEAWARFSASRMLDLEFTVRFTDEPVGDHVLHLKLITPKGYHYQTLSIPITTSTKRQGSQRRVEGYPRPLAVRLVQKAGVSSSPEVRLSVPVGGTPIVTSSIFGGWTAEAYLDDQVEACASQPFVLIP
jgi:hypothetical protein